MLTTMRKQRWIPRVTLLLFFFTHGLRAEIIVDGQTNTTVDVNGNVADVFTTTTSGDNAYNSFSIFNVDGGEVVNLHLPDATNNLLNLVHDQSTTIDGMLNAIKDGQIGGNVYFANPHGFVVGADGVVNVGSLSVSTPTSQFMDDFFSSPGQISQTQSEQMLNYSLPLNDTGLVSIQGKVNATGEIDVRASAIDVGGLVQSGAVFTATAPNFSDVVNLADAETGTTLSVTNGEINIVASNNFDQTGSIVSNGANVSVDATHIDLNGGALISAASDDGSAGGNVTLTATDSLDVSAPQDLQTSASATIADATIEGFDISVTATADTVKDVEGSGVVNFLLGGLKLIDLNSFEAGGLQVGSIESSATATVDIGPGANLSAENNVTLRSDADAEARISVLEVEGVLLPLGIGAAYAKSDAKAETLVQAGASITTGGLLDIDADATNTVEVAAVGLGRESIVLSLAEATTDADASVAAGAEIDATNIDIDARSTSDITNTARPVPLIGATGGAIAATHLRSNADASMGANADIAGDLNVRALSETTNNTTKAKAKVQPLVTPTKIGNLFRATAKATKVSAGAASAFAISDSKHVANASIGAGADVAAENVAIEANTVDRFKLFSESEAETTDFSLSAAAGTGEFGNEANAFIGENATVDARDTLTIKAKTKIPTSVEPERLFFWQAPDFWTALQEFIGIGVDPQGAVVDAFLTSSSIAKSQVEGDGTGISGMYTGIEVDNVANAYIASGAQINTDQTDALATQTVNINAINEIDMINMAGSLGGTTTLGGAVNNLDLDVDVKASIFDDANVNAEEDINVGASSTENIINIAVAGGSAQTYGLAGSVNVTNIDNNVQALIDDKANVHAGRDVNVTAADTANNIAISGGIINGSNTGVGFAWAVNNIISYVKAFFGNDPDVENPGTGDAGTLIADNSVTIEATSTQNLDAWSLAGSRGGPGSGDVKSTSKGGAGFGASGDVSFNTVDGETAAYVDSGVTVDADFVIDLDAKNTAQLNARSGSASIQSGTGSVGIAGSYSENNIGTQVRAFIDDATIARRPDDTYTVVQVDAISEGGISAVAIGGGASSSGINIAGSVAVNEIGDDEEDVVETEAFIANTTLERANVEVNAEDHRNIGSFTGAVSGGSTAGVGPAASFNNVSNDTHAYLDNVTVTEANGVAVSALNDNDIQAISASVGIGTASFGGAGSLSHNTIDNSSEAFVRDSEIQAALNDVSVDADDTSFIRSIAGGGAFGSSLGVGISAAYNDIANRIRAFFDDSVVNTDGSVVADASSDADIETFGLGIGASGNVGLAGSVSINKLRNEITAEIGNNSQIHADDNVRVAASNTNELLVVAGSASGGATGGGGGALVINIVDNETQAMINDANVIADANGDGMMSYSGNVSETDSDADEELTLKGVIVDAYSRANITSANVNGSGGGTAGVAASTSVSTIKDETTALIKNSNINQLATGATDNASADQQVRVSAYERVEFGGGSGNGAGGGTAGVGVGVDVTVVKNKTTASIEDESNVAAKSAIDIDASHREKVLSASVGGGGGGVAGVVGSGNGARLASTTEAYALDSDLNSDGSIGVKASENAELIQIAGGIAGGGAVGVTGAVGVGIIENTTKAYLANGTTTNATDATTISAKSDETIDHYVISASGGGTVGVAANVSVKVANSTTQAFVDGGVTVNQGAQADGDEQDVIVSAESDVTLLGATGGASIGGVVGGGAAIDLDFVKNTTSAYIGDGAQVSANRDVDVSADAYKDVSSFAVGGGGGGTASVSAMVSVINIGASLDEDSRSEVGDAGSYADGQVSGDTTQGADTNDSFVASATDEATADNSDTTVADEVSDTSTTSQNRTSAFIGNLAQVDAARNLDVTSKDETVVQQLVGGISVSLGGAVGGSVGITNTNTYNQAIIGSGATVSSGSAINVDADSDTTVGSVAIAGAGGLVGLGAAVAVVNDNTVTLAEIEDGVSIDRAGPITVNADADIDLSTQAIGTTAGAGAVGASVARSNSGATTLALVSDGVSIGTTEGLVVSSLDVNAVSDIDADAHALAGTAGIISGSGADARSNIDSTTRAVIGDNSDVHVQEGVNVTARALNQGHAQADGVNVAGLTVGISIARADATPEVEAAIGANTNVEAGGDVSVLAAHNVDENGVHLTDRKMHARAFSAAGALIGGVGSDARASVTPDVDVNVGLGANITSVGDVSLESINVAVAEADANGQAYGVAAGGVTRAEAAVDANTDITTADNVVIDGRNVIVSAEANLFADADTVGGNGGLLSIGGTSAKARIDNSTAVNLGMFNDFTADQAIVIEAKTALDANSDARVSAGGAVTVNQVSADTDIDNTTSVDIGADSTLSAFDVTVQSLVTKLVGYAKAASTTFAVGSDSEANSFVDVESNVDVNVHSGAELRGQNTVNVIARTTGINIDSIADAKIGGGLTGNLAAVAHGDLDAFSDIDIRPDAIITSPNISLLSETVSNSGDFNRDADADANTVVNWVLQRSTELVRKAEKIPFIGWFFKWVRKTVFRWVAEVLQSDVSAQVVGGNPITDNSIVMNGTLAQLTALSPELTVNADGSIDSDGNINAEIVNGEVVVNGVNNNVVGTIDISSPGGTVSGAGTLLLNKTFDSVNIVNNSNLDMRVNNVDVLAANAEDPELTIDADLDLTTFTVVSEVDVSDVNVQGNTDADIIIAGDISNPLGTTSIANTGGDILGDGGSIEANQVSLVALNGNIGQGDQLVRVNLVSDFEDAELTVFAGGSAYLDVQLTEYLDEVPAGHVIDGLTFNQMTAGENLVLNLRSGIVYDLPDEPGLEPIAVAAIGRYNATELSAGMDVHITEEALADFRYTEVVSVNGSIEMNLLNGDASISRLRAQNGDVSIMSSGAIENGVADGGANIIASNIDLVANNGIGDGTNGLEISQVAGGVLNASAQGDVYLTSQSGGLGVGLIEALGHYVSIIVDGSLFNGNDDDSDNVRADSLLVQAAGAIGTEDKSLVVDSGDGLADVVDLFAGTGIFVEESNGDLNSAELNSAAGNIGVHVRNGGASLGSVVASETVKLTTANGDIGAQHLVARDLVVSAGGTGSTIDATTVNVGASIAADATTTRFGEVRHTGTAGSALSVDVVGDFTADLVESQVGSVQLDVSGSAVVAELATIADAHIATGSGLDVGNLNAVSLTAGVAQEDGVLHIANAQIAETINLQADHVAVDYLRDTNGDQLTVNVVGNDGGLAQTVNMSIDTMGSLFSNFFKSVYATLTASTDTVLFEHLVVGEQFDIETNDIHVTLDYKDSKDNENSDPLETRDQPVSLTIEGTKVTAKDAQNLFVIKERL